MNLHIILAAAGFLFLKTGEKFATQDTAGPTVSTLAAYAGKQSGSDFDARIFNDPAKAIDYCVVSKPPVGIVTPGFYLTYAKTLGMEALLEAKQQKVDAERYVLVTRKDAPDDVSKFAGKTIATPLAAEQQYVIAVILQNKLGEEIRLKSVTDVEGAVFDLAEKSKNAPDAILMEEATWKVISLDSELGPQTKAVFTSDDLPRNLVVLFRPNVGKLDVDKFKLSLKNMSNDPAGKEILNSVRVESFSDIDEARLKKAQERFHAK